LIKWILLAVLAALALGQFITGDVLYGYDGRWRYPSRWIPPKQRTFTPAELALYNGRDPSRPIYLSILGNVYDVTRGGSTYKPGGSYWFFAGKDASRAYVTGCFKTHLTHDLRGLGEEDLQQIDAWNTFFAENPRYQKVGTLQLPLIDPKTSPPEPC
ncbi:cytochrome b5, partial [Jaminaea rosea]